MNKVMMSEQNQAIELFDRMSYGINTCLPGVIKVFYPDTQTALVTPAIKARVIVSGQDNQYIEMPSIVQVPICYPFAVGNGFALTLPVKVGDPCILIFSQRCIDNWHKLGGIQEPEAGTASRHHNINDAFALLCAPPLTDVLADWLNTGIELRNRDRTTRLTVLDTQTEAVSGKGSLTVKNSGLTVSGRVQTDNHVVVGSGASGTFIDQLGKLITVQDGIIIGGLD